MLEKYELVQTINDEHKIYLVKNILDDSFYVKKELSVYDIDIYNYLSNHNFKGIPNIKEFYELDNKLIVIEEYIQGSSIEEILDSDKLFSENEVKDIVLELCSILKKLNKEKDFVHRDIKPSNLILNENNELYLIDFNAAKFSTSKNRDTVLLGTEGYAAPEQYGFAESNIQSDIYAIGVLTKEMLTGTNNLNNNYKSSLKPVINKCTRLDPKSRYQSFNELIKDINKRRYLPVGFRTGKWWKIIIAIIIYFLIFLLGSMISYDETTEGITKTGAIISKIGSSLTFIVMFFFAGNYLNIQDFFRINQRWNIIFKIIVVTVIDIFLGLSCLITMLLISSMF